MILMFGDIHGDFRHVYSLLWPSIAPKPSFLGDIEASEPLEQELKAVMDLTEVWWIQGNHDTDSVENWRNLFEGQLADRNLHGRVIEIAGVKVAGLGACSVGKSGIQKRQKQHAITKATTTMISGPNQGAS